MITSVAQVALVVREYDEAIRFYCDKLGFLLVENTMLKNKRWVRIRPPGSQGAEIILSKAANSEQIEIVGNQAGGRVLFFLNTDDFDLDFELFQSRGVEFVEGPFNHAYGKVAVLKDLYGNRIDLIERK